MREFFKDIYGIILLGWLLALVVLVAPLSLIKGLNHDELEHIHATWYIASGYLPYLDFFQNHNPLSWYLHAPVISLFGETLTSIYVIRGITLLFMAGTLALAYVITRKLTSCWKTGVLAVLILLTSSFYVKTGFEFRPDVHQVFFGTLALLFLVDFWERGGLKTIFFCGASLAISFLFLQKGVFLIAAIGLVFLFQFLKERMSFRFAAWFAAGFLLPSVIFLAWLLANGLLGDYVITNHLVNLNRLRGFSPLSSIRLFIGSDYLFFLSAVLSFPYLLLGRGAKGRVKKFAFIGLLVGFSILLYDRPHRQGFLQFLVLAGITSAIMLQSLFNRHVLYQGLRIALVFMLLGVPVRSIAQAHRGSMNPRLESIEYVVRNTEPGDALYDGNIMFNVFRPDLHYVWYSVKKNKLLDSYNLVTDGRYGDYDIYDLISRKKPKFISLHAIDTRDPRFRELRRQYKESPYSGIFERVSDGHSGQLNVN